MTGVVSAERAKSARLTGAAGLLILGSAIAMMVMAAPSQVQAHPRPHGAAAHAVTQSATELSHQLPARSDSTMVRACRAGPSAVRAWADAYTPSMISESWPASRSGRAAWP
jgi:hypothetical protein